MTAERPQQDYVARVLPKRQRFHRTGALEFARWWVLEYLVLIAESTTLELGSETALLPKVN